MNLSSPFINRPIMTTLLMTAILLFGIFAYKYLPISDLPNIDYPTITVVAGQPGGSPDYMASLVATPLERNFSSISGLTTLTSRNLVGISQIVLNFDLDVDLNSKEVEVAQAISETLPNLPPLPVNPTYEKTNPSASPIIFMVLSSSTQSLAELYEVAYNILAQPISIIKGISKIQTYGLAYAVRIQADPLKLMSHKVDLNGLANSLTNANPNLPSGLIRGRYEEHIINSFGMLDKGTDYNNVIIRQDNGIPLYVSDVAEGISALDSLDPYFHYITAQDDKPTVILAISRLPDSNTLDISKQIAKKLPILKKGIPPSMELNIFYDNAGPILESVIDVEYTLLIALFLVVVVIFFYLGRITETIIPSLVLPLAIIATFIAMYLIGFSLDILSLLALTLSIGFVVDDSIVVLENIVRHIEMDKPPYEAALDGSRQISTTVLTMTIALSAVFIPFIWMPGILGRIFHEFALTMVIAIFCSGFISLTLNPMLCSRYLKPRLKNTKESLSFSARMNAKLVSKYEWLLLHSLNYRKTTLFIGILCVIFSMLLIYILKTDFVPSGNLDLIEGIHLFQQGSSKINTINHLKELNEIIRKYPYQNGFVSLAGTPANDQGFCYIRLVDSSKRPNASQIVKDLQAELSTVVGANTYLKPYPFINLQVGTSSSLGNYQYVLVSTDAETLYPAAKIFIEKMQKMPELTGVNSDMRTQSPQLNITIDRDRAGVYGITAHEIESTLQYAYSGGRIATFSKDINLYDLILEVAPGFDLLVDDLDLLYIKAPTTQELVPLTEIASWKEIAAPSTINHFNTFPAVTVSFNLAEHVSLGPVLEKIDQLAQEILPLEVMGQIQGAGEVFRQTFQSLKWLIILAIVIIYLLLGILYESFIHPITVLSALPVATLGGLFTLWIFNEPLSLYSIVGLIVLIGIVQKNGIMMIDFALEYMLQPGETPRQAIIEACKARFRPIIMTTLAAMMGAVPIAIGFGVNAETNRSVGLVIVGGLIISQLITLFLTPVVFLYMEHFQEWANKRLRKSYG